MNILRLSTSHSEMEYQPFKLKKEFEQRSLNNQPFEALRVATGLEFIAPDNEVRSPILNDLFPTNEGDDQNPGKLISNCEVLMVVAMYNESSEHFTNTLIGVNENLEDFERAGVDPKKIAWIVILDGIKAFLEIYEKEKGYFEEFFDEKMVKRRF